MQNIIHIAKNGFCIFIFNLTDGLILVYLNPIIHSEIKFQNLYPFAVYYNL